MKFNIFQPKKIKGKLLIAFGAVLFLSSILAGWGYYSINRIMEIRGIEKNFSEIGATVLKMRKSEKDFLARDIKNAEFMSTGESKYIQNIDQLVHLEDSLLSSLITSKWSDKLEIKDELVGLNKNISVYHEIFDKVVKAYRQRGFKDHGDEGKLRAAIKAVEDSNMKIDMVQLLTLRRLEKDFFIRRDMEDVEKFRKGSNRLETNKTTARPAQR